VGDSAEFVERDTWVYEGGLLLSRLVGILGFRLRAWGVERVPRTGGMLLVSNHASFLDPPLLGSPLPRQVAFMARRSLFSVPLLGPLIARCHAFPVERGEADLGAMRRAIRVLRRGCGLVLFPEGTRTADGAMQRFRPGFALLASRAGVPIVPAAICGTFEAWPRHQALPRFGQPVTVAYGEPMPPPAKDKAACEAAARQTQERVAALAEGLKTRC
jgi:1-acyl-sn-glycerol-3-phosphate acyltransferase